jgi:type II secretory pathway pseudopilin PulG
MIHHLHRRRGLTLTEVLVVAGLVALLVGLLLPFLRRMREGPIRAQCANNLKQIGQAITNYTVTNGPKFPALSSSPVHNGRASPQSLFFTILPCLGEKTLYDIGTDFAAEPGLTWTGQTANGPIWSAGFVKTYVCPADPTNSTTQPTAFGWVGCSYGANYQVFGTSDWASAHSFATIGAARGTSNTVFLAERFAQFPGPDGRFTDPDGVVRQANTLWAWPANSGTSPPTAYRAPVPQNAAIFAYSASPYPTGRERDFDSGYGDKAYDLPQAGISPGRADYRRVQSGHREVVQVGMGDGSIREISSGVQQPYWWQALSTYYDPMEGEGPPW